MNRKDNYAIQAQSAKLGGTAMKGADISYRLELFDGLPICLQFWHADEEFEPRLRFLWDENTLMRPCIMPLGC